ncbi:hypothetical protein [Chitinophaga sp.]|uniref:hypothetical protein n=1 Tax=Chitinophaga sp. TaxID=1869181 RepID=UPI0031D0A485
MKHSFVFSPKQILTVAAIVLGCSMQASAQSEAFAYAGTRKESPKTHAAIEEKNAMVLRGCKMNILQDADAALRFLVFIENPAMDKLTLYIKDSNNNTLHREDLQVTSPRFVARYNLENLEDGAYTFEVRNGKDKLERAVDIKTQTLVNRVVLLD